VKRQWKPTRAARGKENRGGGGLSENGGSRERDSGE